MDGEKIFWGMQKRKDKSNDELSKIEFLKAIRFFENLSSRQIKAIDHIIHERSFSEDEYIFEYEQPGAALFLVRKGEIAIEVPTGEGWATVATLGEGSFLGEIALITNVPRTASARATKSTEVFALFRSDLNSLLTTHPVIAGEIYKALSTVVGERLVDTTNLIKKLKSGQNG